MQGVGERGVRLSVVGGRSSRFVFFLIRSGVFLIRFWGGLFRCGVLFMRRWSRSIRRGGWCMWGGAACRWRGGWNGRGAGLYPGLRFFLIRFAGPVIAARSFVFLSAGCVLRGGGFGWPGGGVFGLGPGVVFL